MQEINKKQELSRIPMRRPCVLGRLEMLKGMCVWVEFAILKLIKLHYSYDALTRIKVYIHLLQSF